MVSSFTQFLAYQVYSCTSLKAAAPENPCSPTLSKKEKEKLSWNLSLLVHSFYFTHFLSSHQLPKWSPLVSLQALLIFHSQLVSFLALKTYAPLDVFFLKLKNTLSPLCNNHTLSFSNNLENIFLFSKQPVCFHPNNPTLSIIKNTFLSWSP